MTVKKLEKRNNKDGGADGGRGEEMTVTKTVHVGGGGSGGGEAVRLPLFTFGPCFSSPFSSGLEIKCCERERTAVFSSRLS